MRILIVHNAYQSHFIGGEDIVVRTEISALKTFLGEDNVFEYIVNNDDIRFRKLALNLWGNQTHFKNVKMLVQNNKIDIVHVHNFFPLLTPLVFSAAKSAGAKVIHTLHNFRWWCLSGILYRPKAGICDKCVNKKFAWPAIVHRCYRRSMLQSLVGSLAFAWYRFKKYDKHIDAYFVLSDFQRTILKQWLPSNKLLLKPNPIAFRFVPATSQTRKGYLFVGRLEQAKGIELLLSTWKSLPDFFQLSIIGEGTDAARLAKEYNQPNIAFLGQLPHDEVIKKMKNVKYLLHTSLAFETFGLTLIEAFSQGTPVIGLARGTRLELIENEKNGFICEPEKLKETILNSYDYAGYEQLSINATRKSREFFLDNVMSKQIALYKEFI